MIKKSIALLGIAALTLELSAMMYQKYFVPKFRMVYTQKALAQRNILDHFKTEYKLSVNSVMLSIVETKCGYLRDEKACLQEVIRSGEQVHSGWFEYNGTAKEIFQPDKSTIKLLNLLRNQFFKRHFRLKIEYLDTKTLNEICLKFNKNVIPEILQSKRTRRLISGE